MHQQATTDELRSEYRRAHLWRLGYSFAQAVAAPLVRKGLELAARAHRRAPKPIQGRLL